MVQPERNMSVGAGQGPESATAGQQISPVQAEGRKLPQVFTQEQVQTNAQLSETKRLEAAGQLLGHVLTEPQQQALRKMHEIGKERSEAGVFNYTKKELGQKIKEGREAFSREEWKVLIRSGLAGKLTAAEFAAVLPGFDPASFTDPQIQAAAQKLKTWGDAGKVDEVVAYRVRTQIGKLADVLEVDPVEAEELQNKAKTLEERADDPWFPQADKAFLREKVSKEGGSAFNWAKEVYEYYMAKPMPADLVKQQELANLRNQTRLEVQNLINQADQLGILKDARDRALEFYKQFRTAKRHDKWGRDKGQIIDYARMQSYNEAFWADDPTLKQRENTFRGVGKYLFDGIVAEAYKDFSNKASEPSLNVIAKEEFHQIQEQRRRDRLSEKKYEVNNYYGRRSYELAAENAAELPGAILEWVRDQLAELPDTDMQTVDGKLKEIRAEAEQLLGTNRVHLEKDEGQNVPETHPDFLRAKAAFEAVTDSIGYEKIISWDEKIAYEGGGEVAASYVERFASGYVGHHNAIYLMRRVARILLKLRTHKEGTYWTGHPFSEEKVDLGYMRKYRQQLQEDIIEDAATHDIFTETIFVENQDLFLSLIQTPEDREDARLGYSGFFELRDKYKLQYSNNDPLEKMLLDPGDVIRQRIAATGDVEALARHDMRVKVFRDIKSRRDNEEGLSGLTPQQRANIIRQRIINKMSEKLTIAFYAETTRKAIDEMQAAARHGDIAGYDKAMWKWVEDYNNCRAKEGLQVEGDSAWYPSMWDMIRMKIDRAEKVLDRKLTDEQIDAMYEKVQFSAGAGLADYSIASALDESRFAFQVSRGYAMLEMEDSLYGGIRTRIRNPGTGEIIDLNHKVMRIFDIVQGRLEKAITEEEIELDQFRTTKELEIDQAEQAHDFDKAKELRKELDLKILSAQFLATHALKARGFVDGKLPVWDGQLKSESVINFFGDTLAVYGVNVALGEGISHNSKDWLYEIIERGRRAWQSEWNIAAQEFMVGKYPVPKMDYDIDPASPTYGQLVPQFDAQGKAIKAEAYRKNVYGEEETISERDRIVNLGAPSEHQGIVDTRFNSSTSGGIAVPEFTDELADLLFAVHLVKLGVTNIAGLHGYIAGLDEVQAMYIQRIFTSSDAELSAKERGAAYNARKALMGGKIAEGKSGPGFGNEPYHGGFKAADWLHNFFEGAMKHKLRYIYNYVAVMQQGYRQADLEYSEFMDTKSGVMAGLNKSGSLEEKLPYDKGDVERLRQLSYLDLDGLTKPQSDDLNVTVIGILDYFEDYLKARKGCIQSRGGRALRSWEEENLKSWYVFRRKIREAAMGKKENGEWVKGKKPEQGFIIRLGYSPEVANEAILRMMEGALVESEYVGLFKFEVQQRVRDGEDILYAALIDSEKDNGFEIYVKDNAGKPTAQKIKTFVIPDEKDWSSFIVEPRVRNALKNIRRRGLLEFMTEEGYKWKNSKGEEIKEILGQKIPPLVQDKLISAKSKKVKNAFNPISIAPIKS